MAWLRSERGLDFADYESLWQWSVSEIEAFWASIWDYCGIVASQPYSAVLAKRIMPGAQWFVDARLNFAENIFSKRNSQRPALLYRSETEPLRAVS